MSPEECAFLRKMAPNYEAYMTNNPETLLTRFFGCHSVSLYGKMYYFVVMGNLFADTDVVHHRYDIKGSWIDRNAKIRIDIATAHRIYGRIPKDTLIDVLDQGNYDHQRHNIYISNSVQHQRPVFNSDQQQDIRVV
ncbi:hypothetical protein PsorP6_006603 [Peronosclerospora sorghi]|uniref:Uncharacterized protein n=1 Tax=Peronosclerospora sorghi TaxID=230839 RepID=A0ACC0W2E0_9STRA|nr:hypothetical protein PsorP6_006603 [Peronosclerospora sorghi]